jgi:hypothetical protein
MALDLPVLHLIFSAVMSRGSGLILPPCPLLDDDDDDNVISLWWGASVHFKGHTMTDALAARHSHVYSPSMEAE